MDEELVSKYKCMRLTCGMEFYPIPPDYSCPNCGGKVTEPIRRSRKKRVSEILAARERAAAGLGSTEVVFDCAFQRKVPHRSDMRCALTGVGSYGGVLGTAFSNYDSCLIDICPLYQTWKLLKEKGEQNARAD